MYCSRKCAADAMRLPKAVCKHCGKSFQPDKKKESTFCSRDCAFEHKKAEPKQPRVCICPICGLEFPGRYRRKFCSDDCLDEKNRHRSYENSAKRKRAVELDCKECGRAFVPEYGNKCRIFCSTKCLSKYNRRISHSVRRARICKASKIDWFDPRFILKRDHWQCYLCGVKTPKNLRGSIHPDAPEVDHVVPLSKGGTHTEDNVRCICRRCNQMKSDSLLNALTFTANIQLRMI